MTAPTPQTITGFDALTVALDHGVLTVTLDRPDQRNVVSDDPLMSELTSLAQTVGDDPAVRCLVLTGRGPAFSAGGNIRKMLDGEGMFGSDPAGIVEGYRTGVQRLVRAVHAIPVPTIAAINGPAIGAGFDLALACDLRLCATTAKVGETFVNLGIVPGDGGSWFLSRAVGPQRAMELALTGRVLGADEALALGLVLSLHDPDQLLAAASELAASIAAKPPMAVRWTKQLVRRADRATLDDVLDATAPLQAILHGTAEHKDALRAMLEQVSARR
jgi:enoyl-CoA hydratase/carnithine racemase